MDQNERTALPIGIGVALGAGLGTVLFALTQNPVWIGLGAGIGVTGGAAASAFLSATDNTDE